jgi:hypothetical protein
MTFLFKMHSINNTITVFGLQVRKLQCNGMAFSSLQMKNVVYICVTLNGKM